MEKENIYMSWCEKFSCPGGDCGLTCCTQDWSILLKDEEIEEYEKLDNPIRDDVIDAIDYDKKRFKCENGLCKLLDENQYCRLVINCGVESLCFTCSSYPWSFNNYDDICECYTSITCPIVAEYLFDSKPITFIEGKTDDPATGVDVSVDEKLLLNLMDVKKGLIDMIQYRPGYYVYGKLFLLLKVFDRVHKLWDEKTFNDETVDDIFNNYLNLDVIDQVFKQCDSIKDSFDVRKEQIYDYFCLLMDIKVDIFYDIAFKHRPYVKDYLDKWRHDKDAFMQALKRYLSKSKERYPHFVENMMVYSIFADWSIEKDLSFGKDTAARIVELFLFQIGMMAAFEEKGYIDRKESSVVIATLDRRIMNNLRSVALLFNHYEEKYKTDPLFFVMTLIA